MKVIAIDDEPLMLKALVTALNASEDIESVKEFSSCDACLEWVKDNYIDAAFMDIYMRGMGGLISLYCVRHHAVTEKTIRII